VRPDFPRATGGADRRARAIRTHSVRRGALLWLVATSTLAIGCAGPDQRDVDALTRQFETDPRLTLVDVRTSRAGLAGFVEHPAHRDVLTRRFGRGRTDAVVLLPEGSDTPERFAVATMDAVVRADRDDRLGTRDNVTQLLMGEPVWVLDRDDTAGTPDPEPDLYTDTPPELLDYRDPDRREVGGGAVRVHTADGYLGWVDERRLRFVLPEAFAAALRGEPSDRDRAAVDAAIAKAREYLGTRYLWGGRARNGIDCSGLAQVAYAAAGVNLPRDADMQARVGRLVATRWFTDALAPGDLLFYVHPRRGNVHHVAIYLGDGRYIEAADGGVRVRSMRAGDANHDADRAATFGWARRVVG